MEKRLPQVDRLYIELTNICNFKCDFCPSRVTTRKPQHMEFSLFKSIVDEVANEKITTELAFYVLGEPLLYPRLLDAISYAKDNQLEVEITTNGSLLKDKILENLISSQLDTLVVSIGTVNKKEHGFRNSQLPFETYYKRIIEAVEAFKKHSQTTVLLRLISTYTKKFFDIEKQIEIGEGKKDFQTDLYRFVSDIINSVGLEVSRGKVEATVSKVNLHEEQILWLSDNLGIFVRPFVDWGNAFTSKKVHLCKAGFCSLAFTNMGVLCNGDIIICCGDFDGNTSIGNLYNSSLASTLTSVKARNIHEGFKKFRVVHPHCRKCLGGANPLRAFIKGLISIYLFRLKSMSKPRDFYLA